MDFEPIRNIAIADVTHRGERLEKLNIQAGLCPA
jgi:hypothetical protein